MTSTQPHLIDAVPNGLLGAQSSQSEQNRLALIWGEYSKPAETFQRYKKTAVLMLYWEDSDLDTKPEVDDLATVFEQEYKFQVVHFSIKREKQAQIQLNYSISKFVHDNHDDGTLLIVYYAGHGHASPGEKDFLIAGRTHQEAQGKKRDIHIAAWTTAEHNLRSTPADVLAIFDCCFAGALCQARGLSASRFEYLGACSAEQRTRPPGKTSFTKALIWALKNLRDGPPFTTAQLSQKIKGYHDFPKDQYPGLGSPWKLARDFIMICPMDRQAEGVADGADSQIGELTSETMDLRLHFSRQLSDGLLKSTAMTLNDVFTKEKNLFVDFISFLGKNTQTERLKITVKKWQQIVNDRKRERRESEHEQESTPTGSSAQGDNSLESPVLGGEIVISQHVTEIDNFVLMLPGPGGDKLLDPSPLTPESGASPITTPRRSKRKRSSPDELN